MRIICCSGSLLPRIPPCHTYPLQCNAPSTHTPLPCIPPPYMPPPLPHMSPSTMHAPLPCMSPLPPYTIRGQNGTRLCEPYLSETTVCGSIDITSGFRHIWSEVLPLRCSSSPRGSTPPGSPSQPRGTLNLRSPRCICVCRRKINGTFIPVIYLVFLWTVWRPQFP